MKKCLLVVFLVLIFTGCMQARSRHQVDPIVIQDLNGEIFEPYEIPDSYAPVDFSSDDKETDIDKKKEELYKLKDYKLISEIELNEMINELNSNVDF